jgi:hypothetical protein
MQEIFESTRDSSHTLKKETPPAFSADGFKGSIDRHLLSKLFAHQFSLFGGQRELESATHGIVRGDHKALWYQLGK